MNIADVLSDALVRVRDAVHGVVENLDADELGFRADPQANSVAWLVWHLTRVQDDHLAAIADAEEVWRSQGWDRRFDLPFDSAATGYGHSSVDVAALDKASASLLLGYHDAVFEASCALVSRLSDDDLDRIVDESFDPPVSLGTRLVSVLTDDLMHVGQAAFVAGLSERRHG